MCGDHRGPEGTLSARDAARLLGLNHNAVYGLAAKGELRPVPHSWPHMFRRAEVLAYMERCRVKPGDLRHLNQYAKPTSGLGKDG